MLYLFLLFILVTAISQWNHFISSQIQAMVTGYFLDESSSYLSTYHHLYICHYTKTCAMYGIFSNLDLKIHDLTHSSMWHVFSIAGHVTHHTFYEMSFPCHNQLKPDYLLITVTCKWQSTKSVTSV